MKLRHPLAIRFSAFALAGLAKGWIATLKFREVFLDGIVHPVSPASRRCIYAVWHDSILMVAKKRTNIRFLISQHADGELATRVCDYFRAGAVRGSSTRGGASALLQMARPDDGHLLITPDGPRGPRRRLQPGIIRAASITGMPIVLAAYGFDRAWRAPSWDRMAVPCPGSTVYCVVSEMIQVPPGLSRPAVEQWRSDVEQRFVEITESAERWAAGGPRPVVAPARTERQAA